MDTTEGSREQGSDSAAIATTGLFGGSFLAGLPLEASMTSALSSPETALTEVPLGPANDQSREGSENGDANNWEPLEVAIIAPGEGHVDAHHRNGYAKSNQRHFQSVAYATLFPNPCPSFLSCRTPSVYFF